MENLRNEINKLSLSEVKQERKIKFKELEKKENETKEDYRKRKQDYYTSFINNKDEYLVIKESFSRFSNLENYKEFKKSIFVGINEFDLYSQGFSSVYELLEYELKSLLYLDVDSQLKVITYGAIKFNINIDAEHEELCNHYEKIKIDHYKKIEYIENKLDKLNKTETNKQKGNNPYPRIFTTPNAYKIFNHFAENINEQTQLADYSYIFRRMQSDNLIFKEIRNTEYKEWLNTKLIVTIEKVKVLNDCKTIAKEQFYTILKNQYKE